MPERECRENRKNILDGTWLNPKYCKKWATSSQALKRRRFNDYSHLRSRMQAIGIRSW